MNDGQRELNEPITPMAEMAANLREIFEALIQAGFTEKQSCFILGAMIAGQG